MTVPLAQRRPSPNAVPLPAAVRVVPWKNSVLAAGRLSAVRTTVSFTMLESPDARSRPPTPVLAVQPTWLATGLLLPHGHCACGATPSPAQYTVPIWQPELLYVVTV